MRSFYKKIDEDDLFKWYKTKLTIEAANNTAPASINPVTAPEPPKADAPDPLSSNLADALTDTTFDELASVKPVSREAALNLLLASIALDDFSLARLLNAETEKLQTALGMTENCQNEQRPVIDIKRFDRGLNSILQDVISKEMLILFRLQAIIDEITNTGNSEQSQVKQ
jgi:hypothetical protein